MRSQQRTSWGFDSDADPRLETRMAAAAFQRAFDPDPATTEAEETIPEADVPDEWPALELVGARGQVVRALG